MGYFAAVVVVGSCWSDMCADIQPCEHLRLWCFMWHFPGTGEGYFSHARAKVMASQRSSESGRSLLRRKGRNEMMAIKTNEEGTRIPQQNNPSLNPEIKSLFHTAWFLFRLKSVTFCLQQKQMMWGRGNYEGGLRNDNYRPCQHSSQTAVK